MARILSPHVKPMLLAAAALFVHAPSDADPPRHALIEECASARCLGLWLSADQLVSLEAEEGVPVQALAEALRYWHRGTEPVAARLIGMRYESGRLVRYRVSERIELGVSDDALLGAGADAVLGALGPVTEGEVYLDSPVERSAYAPVAVAAFVGNLPPTYLAEEEFRDRSLLDGLPRNGEALDLEGALGILVLLPERSEQRAPEDLQSLALLVQLRPVRR